jgi:hypothetical protein
MLRGEVQRPDDNETCDDWLRRLGQCGVNRKSRRIEIGCLVTPDWIGGDQLPLHVE